jgi:hypothetical protein
MKLKSSKMQTFFEASLTDLKNLLTNGLVVDKIGKIMFNVKYFIADHPARAKFLNMRQFNGRYGCSKCLIKGVSLSRKMIYPYSINDQARKVNLYERHLAQNKNGVLGSFHLKNFIKIPDQIVIDFMHTSCIGLMKQMVDL